MSCAGASARRAPAGTLVQLPAGSSAPTTMENATITGPSTSNATTAEHLSEKILCEWERREHASPHACAICHQSDQHGSRFVSSQLTNEFGASPALVDLCRFVTNTTASNVIEGCLAIVQADHPRLSFPFCGKCNTSVTQFRLVQPFADALKQIMQPTIRAFRAADFLTGDCGFLILLFTNKFYSRFHYGLSCCSYPRHTSGSGSRQCSSGTAGAAHPTW